jgi:hypothetical protein
MKIFANKNKIIFLYPIIICSFIVIISMFANIRTIDIYGHRILIFIKARGSAYLLNPVTIKTELGNIYLKRFANIGWPYIFSDADVRTRFDWYQIKLYAEYMGKDIEYDLNLFGQNISARSIELGNRSIAIWDMVQPIIIDGEKQRLLGLYYVRGSNKIVLTLWGAPSFYMTTTLNGEILEVDGF